MRTGSTTARGFAYLLLLIAIATIGMASAASVTLGRVAQRRGAENQLLAIGLDFQRALQSYSGAARGARPDDVHGPRSLQDLLKDPRAPGVRRHLRRIDADPLTGSASWGTVTNARGEIVGIYSLAPGRPIKQTGFGDELAQLDSASSYREWVFGFGPLRLPTVRSQPT